MPERVRPSSLLESQRRCPMSVDVKYHTTATASGGGRDGRTALADGTMFFDLVIPKELGGPGGWRQPRKAFRAGLLRLLSLCYAHGVRQDEDQTPRRLDRDRDH